MSRIRLLMDYGNHKQHDILPYNDENMAKMLVDLQIAEVIADAPVNGTSLKSIIQAPVDRMMRRQKLTLRTK